LNPWLGEWKEIFITPSTIGNFSATCVQRVRIILLEQALSFQQALTVTYHEPESELGYFNEKNITAANFVENSRSSELKNSLS
jgi:hypothetical protein